jgi:hypothetical protein
METARGGAGHDEAGLDAVRFRWGPAYEVGHDDEHGYWAARRDSIGGLITSTDPAGLSAGIADDFAMRAVPGQRLSAAAP